MQNLMTKLYRTWVLQITLTIVNESSLRRGNKVARIRRAFPVAWTAIVTAIDCAAACIVISLPRLIVRSGHSAGKILHWREAAF